ncbi:nucleotidyl transferase AbiEii/AbiGii toxin family protein [Subtercola endophyticus]|uniref:nucleotidyl transferase AbiEii/AbiGii toxin family protein n=1 Tax=Subtercola endophyticus TaxID=2895559 RepID=UPI001E3C6123|nr:nucleotidyl transferase AbiEii/AbiGii toxin family protein [Subtercola endophyticus]UFS57581.1 nucleotidyl transferase AbiEii/AbiGii toxin family protein [Subtercola endophyticus]
MSDDLGLQWDLTQAALAALRDHAFALAGSGAIREHGIVDRPTQDVDLFTNDPDPESFDEAVDGLVDTLGRSGLIVEQVRRAPRFAQLRIITNDHRSVDMDLAVDWREREPVTLAVGPVLSLEDAVGNKVGALYSRAEARDYLDVDAIRASGRFTNAELISMAAERDSGFDLLMFAGQLEQANRIRPDRVERYGVSADQLDAIRERFAGWARELRTTAAGA